MALLKNNKIKNKQTNKQTSKQTNLIVLAVLSNKKYSWSSIFEHHFYWVTFAKKNVFLSTINSKKKTYHFENKTFIISKLNDYEGIAISFSLSFSLYLSLSLSYIYIYIYIYITIRVYIYCFLLIGGFLSDVKFVRIVKGILIECYVAAI